MHSKVSCPGFLRLQPEENPFGEEDAKSIENLVGHWINIHPSVDQKKGEKGGGCDVFLKKKEKRNEL